MSTSRAQSVRASAKKTTPPRARRAESQRIDPDEAEIDQMFAPHPLPADPAQRADFFAAIQKGIEEAMADQVVDWEDLDREVCKKFGLPPP